MDRGRFVYIKVHIIIIFRLRAEVLVFISINKIIFKIDLINKLLYLNYFYVIYMTKTLMLKTDLGVMALKISWLTFFLSNYYLFGCFNI